jgi:hypothetical protein
MNNRIVFLCGARDFHAMDWYQSAKSLYPHSEIEILTDLIAGEGYKKLISQNDKVRKLVIIDNLLSSSQSRYGHVWRNLVKAIVFPIQAILLKSHALANPFAQYHAHSMYYVFLAWIAGIAYIATPQGSDILIKPQRSRIYKYLTIHSLRAAKAVTVDSVKMAESIKIFSGVDAKIIQNGIDLDSIRSYHYRFGAEKDERNTILSIRGITELYRIKEIMSARLASKKNSNIPISFIYPFRDDEYYLKISRQFKEADNDLARVERSDMYSLMRSSKLVISIPISDSSPRSVYEAIFCGCAVAITYHPYYDVLPECMKSRIILIDLINIQWFDQAIERSSEILKHKFIPSESALNMFDQKRSFRLIKNIFDGI